MTNSTQCGEVSSSTVKDNMTATHKKKKLVVGAVISVCVGGWIGISYAIKWALEASQVNNTLAS